MYPAVTQDPVEVVPNDNYLDLLSRLLRSDQLRDGMEIPKRELG